MIHPFRYRGLLMLSLAALALLAVTGVSAQGENLLINPGFEDPFIGQDGEPDRQVADGWTAWNVEGDAGSRVENRQPWYYAAAQENPDRVLAGGNAQQISAVLFTTQGGVYQVVDGLTPGEELAFSVAAYVWSSTGDDTSVSQDGDVTVEVGIDPTGDTDPESQVIVWSDAQVVYDQFNTYSVVAPAEAETVTVYVRITITDPVLNNDIFLDEASLVSLAAGDVTPEPGGTADDTDVTAEAALEEEATVENASDAETEAAPEDQGLIVTEIVETAEVASADAFPTPTEDELLPSPETETAEAQVVMTEEVSATEAVVATFTPANTDVVSNEDLSILPTYTPTFTPSPTLDVFATALPAQVTPELIVEQTVESSPTATATIDITPELTEVVAAPATEGVLAATPTASATFSLSEEFPSTIIHTVQRNDNVSRLAALYGSTINAILQANGLSATSVIFVGQQLVIPVRVPPITDPLQPTIEPGQPTTEPQATATAQPPIGTTTYVVQPNDNLTSIAARFNTTPRALAQLNGIVNPNLIFVGQRLTVPAPGTGTPATSTPAPAVTVIIVTATPQPGVTQQPEATATPTSPTTYIVQPGDTLYRLSLRFGVSLSSLIQTNNITEPNLIFVGQRLTIP